ncbi:MAG: hypothetical protein A2Y25_05385 [Candidatus Melainabacteria bacterium GWF2_37_15]|nr:MAG: hypothetical protein A2Y25_05385 [Candidatus Melainabacteria bacterium GWF2_37_15]
MLISGYQNYQNYRNQGYSNSPASPACPATPQRTHSSLNTLAAYNKHLVAFGWKPAKNQNKEILMQLAIIKYNLKKDVEEKFCGEIKATNKSGQEEVLNIYKTINKSNEKVYLVRKQDDNKTLIGAAIYTIKNNPVIKGLYNLQDNDDFSYISGEYIFSTGQDEYIDLNLGKKLHQLRIETSILEGCPGKVLIYSAKTISDFIPTGFHYKNGFVPCKLIFEDDGLLRDNEAEKKIIKDMQKNKGYTSVKEINMYLSSENFENIWLKQILKNPLLDETKQKISNSIVNQKAGWQQLSK